MVGRFFVSLAVVLMLAPAVDAWPQSSASSAPAQSAAASQPAAQQTPEPNTAGTRPPHASKRVRRTSRREPASSAREGFKENRPPRTAGPSAQGLAFNSNIVAAYDNNLTAALGPAGAGAPGPIATGSAQAVDGVLAYRRWDARRSILVAPTGVLRNYPHYLQRPLAGGMLDLDGWMWLGQSLRLGGAQILRYDPVLSLSTISTGSAPDRRDEIVPPAGLYRKPSVNNASNLEVERFWGRADSSWVTYAYRADLFTDEARGDTVSHDVLTEHRRIATRWLKLRGSYRYIARESTASDGNVLSSREHRIDGITDVLATAGRERRLTASVGVGAAYLDSSGVAGKPPYATWVPHGSASATLALSPQWSLSAGYQRYFSLLRGITDSVYTTDTAFLSGAAPLTSRIGLTVGATYSNSITPRASGVSDTFRVYGAAVQVSARISSNATASAGYYFYHHQYSNLESLAPGFPAEYQRHAVRLGLTLWVPVAGTPHRWGQPPPRL